MWKIYITYSDKSKIVLTGKGADIPLRLALKYYLEYVNGKPCIQSEYQRYPKKNFPTMQLIEKIEELENQENYPLEE